MNPTLKILELALLVAVLTVMAFTLAGKAPDLMATVGWHTLATVGWVG